MSEQCEQEKVLPGRWFYKTDAGKKGPVGGSVLQGLFAAGEIAANTPVWREGMEGWLPAEQCDDLRGFIQDARWRAACAADQRPVLSNRKRAVFLSVLAGAVAVVVGMWFARAPQVLAVRGSVMAAGKPARGGTIILAPVDDGIQHEVAPGIGELDEEGRFAVVVKAAAGQHLPTRFEIRFSPPVLPPMDEAEAMTAKQQYLGMVPEPAIIDLAEKDQLVVIQLVAGMESN